MADLPIDEKIISNALGFDVKREILIDLDLDIKVEGKTFATDSLYPEINSYDFKILNKDKETRKGSAKKVVGAYLILRKEKRNEIQRQVYYNWRGLDCFINNIFTLYATF